MLSHGEFTSGQYIPGDAVWHNRNGIYHEYFWLGITDLATHFDWAHYVGNGASDWFKMLTYYPGDYSSGLTSPWNLRQPNNATNPNSGGPSTSMNIVSVTAENGVVTVFTRTGHAIQMNDTVTIAGVTGAGGASLPEPNGERTVSGVPSRNSFQFNLSGANGTYSGGWTPELDSAGFERIPVGGYRVEPGYATVTYQPRYSKFRLWVACHIHVAARIIVYDN